MSETSEKMSDLTIIGHIKSPLTQKFGTPRQPNLVNLPAQIILDAPYNDANAVAGLEAFSHIWLIWRFHLINDSAESFRAQVRPPRLGGNKKIGVFASRSMFRPNRMGLSVVQLESIEITNNKAVLHILGADLVDGTPILDIKPYIAYSDAIPYAQSGYAPNEPDTFLVTWSDLAQKKFTQCVAQKQLSIKDKNTITELISLDPRPAYHAKTSTKHQPNNANDVRTTLNNNTIKTYVMRYKTVDIQFYMNPCEGSTQDITNSFMIDDVINVSN